MSTRVGGVPEVLPPGLVEFAEPEADGSFRISLLLRPADTSLSTDLVRAISRAIRHVKSGAHDPVKAHEMLKGMYSWSDVAERTEKVYYDAMEVPDVPVIERLRRCVPTFRMSNESTN